MTGKYNKLINLFIFIFILFLSGCGSDSTTNIITTPTPTALPPTSTPVPATPTVSATVTPTVTPTPNPNTNLVDQFDLLSAAVTYNNIIFNSKKNLKERLSTGGILTIQLRQISKSTVNITDLEIKAEDNAGLQFSNTTLTGGPQNWITSNGPALFSWQGEQPLTTGLTYNLYINYTSIPTVFPSKIHIIVTGGTNHSQVGYIDVPVYSPPVEVVKPDK